MQGRGEALARPIPELWGGIRHAKVSPPPRMPRHKQKASPLNFYWDRVPTGQLTSGCAIPPISPPPAPETLGNLSLNCGSKVLFRGEMEGQGGFFAEGRGAFGEEHCTSLNLHGHSPAYRAGARATWHRRPATSCVHSKPTQAPKMEGRSAVGLAAACSSSIPPSLPPRGQPGKKARETPGCTPSLPALPKTREGAEPSVMGLAAACYPSFAGDSEQGYLDVPGTVQHPRCSDVTWK